MIHIVIYLNTKNIFHLSMEIHRKNQSVCDFFSLIMLKELYFFIFLNTCILIVSSLLSPSVCQKKTTFVNIYIFDKIVDFNYSLLSLFSSYLFSWLWWKDLQTCISFNSSISPLLLSSPYDQLFSFITRINQLVHISCSIIFL